MMTEEEMNATVNSALEKVRLECAMHGVPLSPENLNLIRQGIIMGVTEVDIRRRQVAEDRHGEET